MSVARGRASRFGSLRTLAGVLAVALIARTLAAFLIQWFVGRSRTNRLCVFPDTDYYWLLARTIRAGTQYDVVEWGNIHHRALRTPGYPLFLAVCQALFGESTIAVRLVQAVLGTASVWLVYRLTQQLEANSAPEPPAAPRTGTAPNVAAALAAIDPYSVAISELLLSEALFIPLLLLFLCGLASLWRAIDQPKAAADPSSGWRAGWLAPATGAVAGVAVLTRPSFALYPPAALLVWLIACFRSRERGRLTAALRSAALVLAGAALVMSPWWVRNARIYGRFVPTSVWFGASLYDGLNPSATGASDMKFRESPEFRILSEVDQDRVLARRALDFALSNPGRVLELAVIKLGRYWSPWLNAEEYRFRVIAVLSTVVVVPLYVLLLAGAWARRRDPRALVILAGPLLYFGAVHLVFVSSVRYRVCGAVAAMPLAAIGFDSLAARIKVAFSRV
jgi:4-amino-4-deoxy-L-arabinose transferase-like glycosyltransferase